MPKAVFLRQGLVNGLPEKVVIVLIESIMITKKHVVHQKQRRRVHKEGRTL